MTQPEMVHEKLTYSVIGAFFEVYNTLGFGFREHLYMKALERELRWRGHRVAREVWVTVMYKGEELGKQRLDMVVDDVLLVETKATYQLRKDDTRQLYSYLCAMKLDVALLLHFGPEPQFFRINGPGDVRRLRSRRRSGPIIPSHKNWHPERREATDWWDE